MPGPQWGCRGPGWGCLHLRHLGGLRRVGGGAASPLPQHGSPPLPGPRALALAQESHITSGRVQLAQRVRGCPLRHRPRLEPITSGCRQQSSCPPRAPGLPLLLPPALVPSDGGGQERPAGGLRGGGRLGEAGWGQRMSLAGLVSSFQKHHLEVECRGLKGSRGCSQRGNQGDPERRVPCLRLGSALRPRTDPGLLVAHSCSAPGAVVLGGVARGAALGLGPRESGGTERSRTSRLETGHEPGQALSPRHAGSVWWASVAGAFAGCPGH